MPTRVARLKRGLTRDAGFIILGLILGGLILVAVKVSQDDTIDVAREQTVQRIAQASYRQDMKAWRSRIDGCRRGKKDRAANARAFRAQADYLNLVLDAESVKQDVKDAAAVNQRVQDWAASSLESRTGPNLNCLEVTPKPKRPPGLAD